MPHNRTTVWVARGVAVAVIGAGAALGSALPSLAGTVPGSAAVTTTLASTSADVTASHLVFNREEERLARDLYRLFSDTYGVRVFANIAASEQRHFDAVGVLLTTYGVPDPSAGLAPGTYADPAIQSLYDELSAQGLTSVADAYQVGIAVEQRDIADLEESLTAIDLPDVQTVLTRLMNASENHLAAFEKAASGGSSVGTGQGQQHRHGHRHAQGGGHGHGHGRGHGRG